jgi:PDDEXK-like domain of unknown function (DUF3799)
MSAILDLPHGLHERIPGPIYHARHRGLVSKGALDLLARSPAHYDAWVTGASHDESTPALEFGAAFHCALLEPDTFAATYACEPDFGDCRRKENKAARDAWREEHAGRIPLSANDEEVIRGMVGAVRSHPLAGKMIAGGSPELTVRWRDSDTGLECKCRADYYVAKHGMVLDVKSTLDASDKAFRRDVAKYRYDWQNVLYRLGFSAVDARADHFVFVAVEKAPPYAVGVYTLDSQWHSTAYAEVRRLMQLMAECVKSGNWNGYPCTIRELEMPPWLAA